MIRLPFLSRHNRPCTASEAAAVLGRRGARQRHERERARIRAKARELAREIGMAVPEALQ